MSGVIEPVELKRRLQAAGVFQLWEAMERVCSLLTFVEDQLSEGVNPRLRAELQRRLGEW